MATVLNIAALLAAIKTRLTTLLAGQTLTVRGSETPAAVAIHTYRLPNSESDDLLDDLCPFAVITQRGGSDGQSGGSATVRIVVGIYNEAESGAGDAQLEAIAAAIVRLSEDQRFNPYILDGDINFYFGDRETGAQNHPQYFLTVDLTFVRESVYLNQ